MTISRAGFLATEEAPHGTRVYNEENENVGSGETKKKEKLSKYRRIGVFSAISSEVAQFASIHPSLQDCKKPDAGEILIDGRSVPLSQNLK